MNSNRGDISLVVVIIVGSMMLGSAVLLSLVLAQQTALTEDLVASERAFYAASTGVERAFYDLAVKVEGDGTAEVEGEVVYENRGSASFTGGLSRQGDTICGVVTGTFRGEQRRIQIGPDEC